MRSSTTDAGLAVRRRWLMSRIIKRKSWYLHRGRIARISCMLIISIIVQRINVGRIFNICFHIFRSRMTIFIHLYSNIYLDYITCAFKRVDNIVIVNIFSIILIIENGILSQRNWSDVPLNNTKKLDIQTSTIGKYKCFWEFSYPRRNNYIRSYIREYWHYICACVFVRTFL